MNPSGDKRESSDVVDAAGSVTDQPQQKKSRNVSTFESYLSGLDEEGNVKRPAIPALDPKVDSLIFQQVEVDNYIEKSEDDKGPVPIISRVADGPRMGQLDCAFFATVWPSAEQGMHCRLQVLRGLLGSNRLCTRSNRRPRGT